MTRSPRTPRRLTHRRYSGRRAAARGTAILAFALPVIAAAAILGAAACSRSTAPTPRTEQVFRFRLREDPPNLDPALVTDNLSDAVTSNVFRGLVAMDPATLAVQPAVADSWTVSGDGLAYAFHLRPGVVFHNGRALTADDVAWSFKRLLAKPTNSPRRWLLEPVAGAADFIDGKTPEVAGIVVEAPDRITLRLDKPFAPFLGMLTMTGASIIPREVYEDPSRGYLRAPVGCGPFRLTRWEQANVLEMAAFDRYYGGRPAIDRVQVRIIENRATALEAYRAGDLDSLDEVPTDLTPDIEKDVHRYPFIGVGYIGFNLDLAPFKGNPALRKAINYAVDKEYLWGKLLPGGNISGRGIIPPGIPGYDETLPGYPYDEAKARSLLAQAGYPGGKGLAPISLWVNTSEDNRQIALQIQSDLGKVGIPIKVKEVDWAAYLHAVEGTPSTPGEAQMFRFGWYLDYPDADAVLRLQLHSKNVGPAGNYFRYRNAGFDRLVDEALVMNDPAARADAYRRAERIAVMDDAVWLFLNYFGSATLFKPYVQGIVDTPLGEFRIPLERLRIEKPSKPAA
ncbi:MAG TPA: ABC transporter substrate-binding protein [Candidatus Polarisedimenticolia bacterium]|nr:ABC transporter substrate-binding protein [Candidatus Polarisedimenticolia bacterium]